MMNDSQKKKVLVYFVGGVTFSEIAALRFLNQQPGSKVRFLIATTQIINGNKCARLMNTTDENCLDPLSLVASRK